MPYKVIPIQKTSIKKDPKLKCTNKEMINAIAPTRFNN